jgi:aspartate oxidase
LIAELIVRAALQRHESRGGHYREDYSGKAAKNNEITNKINWSGSS